MPLFLLYDFKRDSIVAKSYFPEKISSLGIDYARIFPDAHLIVFKSIEHYVNGDFSYPEFDEFDDPVLRALHSEEAR